MPPITAIASGCSICDPAPIASASGNMPAMAASAVMTIGRSRRRPAWTIASSAGRPMERNFSLASSSRIPFLATMPTTMIRPMNDETLNVVRVMKSARNTPEVDSNAEDRIARGGVNDRNSNSKTRKIRITASASTVVRSRNDFCCSL